MTSSTPDSVIANNSHTIGAVIVPAGQGVDLRLTKTDSIDPVALNAPFTYTLTVTNVGTTEATNVVVTDNVPAGIAITYATSPSGMCSAISTPGAVQLRVDPAGPDGDDDVQRHRHERRRVTNQASVTAAQIELTPADNVVSETTMVVAVANCAAPSFSGPTIFAANGPTGDVAHRATSTAMDSRIWSRRFRRPTRSRCFSATAPAVSGLRRCIRRAPARTKASSST